MSDRSIPTWAHAQPLTAALLDQQLVPVQTPMGWLDVTVATTDTFPTEVEQAVQLRFGTGPWLLFTTPISFSGIYLKAQHEVHGGGLGIRTPALPGLQLIAQGGE